MATKEETYVGEETIPMTEDEMLNALSNRYVIVPKGNTTPKASLFSDAGARLKTTRSPVELLTPSKTEIFKPLPNYQPFIPKLPLFSGHDPIPKGEVSYTEWRFEVRCLMTDHSLPSSHLLQIIRSSLRGTARRLLIPLGEGISVDIILHKLESTFRDLAPKNVTMLQFFDIQHSNESVTEYACRLESLLHTAMEGSQMGPAAKNDKSVTDFGQA